MGLLGDRLTPSSKMDIVDELGAVTKEAIFDDEKSGTVVIFIFLRRFSDRSIDGREPSLGYYY